MPIIATAGHVDHGKSTLVLALTGRDPDRWAEEKRRGLTIDLGFGWTHLGGHDVGFVDVPGHERFIKNMLAGVGAVDVALFVVAADEGWMPQTEEHLGVLDALGIHNGVIALSRADLVDDELLELAVAETEERITGTTLASWPIIPVSAPQNRGLDELRTELAAALDRCGDPPDLGRPRLWIDRAFTIEGAGLVVTGTLVDGMLSRDETVELWPGPSPARIRSIQTHEQAVDEVRPGSRVALNLTGTDRIDVARGAMLARRDTFRTTARIHAALTAVRTVEDGIANRGAYHLHAGSGHWSASLQMIAETEDGQHAVVRIDEPVPLRMGDRFILREVGRRAVVAGGVVVDPHPGRGSPSIGALRDLVTATTGTGRRPDAGAMAEALLRRRSVESKRALDLDTGGGAATDAIDLGTHVATESWVTETVDRLREMVAGFHLANPMRPGMPKATLASQLAIETSMLDRLILRSDSELEETGPDVRTRGFTVQRSAQQSDDWDRAKRQLGESLAVPRASALPLDTELFHALVRDGELVLVGDDLVYLPEQIDTVTSRLDELNDRFTVAQFRDTFGLSRRHAVPLLEWLDKHGWTLRRGDERMLRRSDG